MNFLIKRFRADPSLIKNGPPWLTKAPAERKSMVVFHIRERYSGGAIYKCRKCDILTLLDTRQARPDRLAGRDDLSPNASEGASEPHRACSN